MNNAKGKAVAYKGIPEATAETTVETTLTNAGTGGDSAIQALTSSTPFGYVTAAEGEQVVETVLNNQVRIAEIIAILKEMGAFPA